jgi:hypothetical protein
MKPHRATSLFRILLTIMLAVGILGMATGQSLSSPALGKDNHGQGHDNKSHKPHKDKDNKGHKKQDKEEKHDNGKHKGKQDKEKKDKDDKHVRAEPVAQYTVSVTCTFDGAMDETTCLFDADSPPNAKKINLFDVPADEVCADVVGGDANYVDPDPNTNVTGYRSTDSDGELTLVFSGEVSTGGSATYWIKAASNIFPASGPALVCTSANVLRPQPTTQSTVPPIATATATATAVHLTPEVTDTTGSIIVLSHLCPIASPPADYDWYGECTAQQSGIRFRLLRIDTETRDGLTTSTDETGRAQFMSLQPGTYELTQAEGDWCFAQSDNVDANGDLIVTAGNRTTVWVFTCAGSP